MDERVRPDGGGGSDGASRAPRGGCRALALLVDTWSRAGEWAQQWHTLSRCVVALARLGETTLCAEVIGAIEAHAAIDCPPVTVTLHDSVFHTRAEIEAELGADRSAEARATGATQPIATTVERTCVALLGSAPRPAPEFMSRLGRVQHVKGAT